MRLLDGEVAWVTGGGRGIGRAAALALAEHGAAVAVSARTQDGVDDVAREIRTRGRRSLAVSVDVSQYGDVDRGVRAVENTLGPITILVNNAAVLTPLGKLWQTDPAAWGHAIQTNLTGAYHCMRALLPSMLRGQRGVIVNVSSGAAISISSGTSAYSAGKAGLEHLTRCLALELAGTPIRVYALRPGSTETRMQEIMRTASEDEIPPSRRQYFLDEQAAGRIFPPETPARAIVWLGSSRCNVENGGLVDLRGQPEYVTRIAGALRAPVA